MWGSLAPWRCPGRSVLWHLLFWWTPTRPWLFVQENHQVQDDRQVETLQLVRLLRAGRSSTWGKPHRSHPKTWPLLMPPCRNQDTGQHTTRANPWLNIVCTLPPPSPPQRKERSREKGIIRCICVQSDILAATPTLPVSSRGFAPSVTWS
jgi:hypothetical protein